jgi:hypothetical protein
MLCPRRRQYYIKNNYLTLKSRSHEGHYGMRHTALWSCTYIPYIIYLSGKTKKLWSGEASLRRSRRKNQTKTICLPSFEGRLQHTALWTCTHIPNIIDLSGKTKKLWSGQAALRRSRRKNQTKTICGEIQYWDKWRGCQ